MCIGSLRDCEARAEFICRALVWKLVDSKNYSWFLFFLFLASAWIKKVFSSFSLRYRVPSGLPKLPMYMCAWRYIHIHKGILARFNHYNSPRSNIQQSSFLSCLLNSSIEIFRICPPWPCRSLPLSPSLTQSIKDRPGGREIFERCPATGPTVLPSFKFDPSISTDPSTSPFWMIRFALWLLLEW